MAADAPKFRKVIATVTIPTGQTSASAKASVGGVKYARVVGFSARITSGADATTILQLSDRNGIFYLDAAAANYTGTGLRRVIVRDDTATGLTGYTTVDSTGAALAAGQVVPNPVVELPITVTWSSATAGEVLRVEILLEV